MLIMSRRYRNSFVKRVPELDINEFCARSSGTCLTGQLSGQRVTDPAETEEVTASNPVSPTRSIPGQSALLGTTPERAAGFPVDGPGAVLVLQPSGAHPCVCGGSHSRAL